MTALRELIAIPIFWLALLYPAGTAAMQLRHVVLHGRSFLRGLASTVLYCVMPALLFITVFLASVLIEEMTGASLVGEEFARAPIPVAVICLAMAVVGALVFLIAFPLCRARQRPV
jgi:hypothetical protein